MDDMDWYNKKANASSTFKKGLLLYLIISSVAVGIIFVVAKAKEEAAAKESELAAKKQESVTLAANKACKESPLDCSWAGDVKKSCTAASIAKLGNGAVEYEGINDWSAQWQVVGEKASFASKNLRVNDKRNSSNKFLQKCFFNVLSDNKFEIYELKHVDFCKLSPNECGFFFEIENACKRNIESKLLYDFEWDGTLFGDARIFSIYNWKGKKQKIALFGGDGLRFQNAYGAWSNAKYACEFDRSKNKIKTEVTSGKL